MRGCFKTEAESERVGSWIRTRVYDTDLAPADAFTRLMDSGTRSLKQRYQDFAMVNTTDVHVVWGWAATEVWLDTTRLSRGGGIHAG